MITLRNILLAIIAAIVIKMGLDYRETLDAVTRANDALSSSKDTDAALKTAYGTADPKKIQQIKDKSKQSEIIATDSTTLTVSGSIDVNTSYVMETQYAATSDDKLCKEFQTTGWSSATVPIGESFEYLPKIEGEHHEIKVPLKLFNPNERCKIELKRIFITIFNRNDRSKSNRMVLYTSVKEESVEYGFYKSLHNTYKVNMECIEPGPFPSTHYRPCSFGSISNRFSVMGVLPNKYYNVELNIKVIPLKSVSKDKLYYIMTGDKKSKI